MEIDNNQWEGTMESGLASDQPIRITISSFPAMEDQISHANVHRPPGANEILLTPSNQDTPQAYRRFTSDGKAQALSLTPIHFNEHNDLLAKVDRWNFPVKIFNLKWVQDKPLGKPHSKAIHVLPPNSSNQIKFVECCLSFKTIKDTRIPETTLQPLPAWCRKCQSNYLLQEIHREEPKHVQRQITSQLLEPKYQTTTKPSEAGVYLIEKQERYVWNLEEKVHLPLTIFTETSSRYRLKSISFNQTLSGLFLHSPEWSRNNPLDAVFTMHFDQQILPPGLYQTERSLSMNSTEFPVQWTLPFILELWDDHENDKRKRTMVRAEIFVINKLAATPVMDCLAPRPEQTTYQHQSSPHNSWLATEYLRIPTETEKARYSPKILNFMEKAEVDKRFQRNTNFSKYMTEEENKYFCSNFADLKKELTAETFPAKYRLQLYLEALAHKQGELSCITTVLSSQPAEDPTTTNLEVEVKEHALTRLGLKMECQIGIIIGDTCHTGYIVVINKSSAIIHVYSDPSSFVVSTQAALAKKDNSFLLMASLTALCHAEENKTISTFFPTHYDPPTERTYYRYPDMSPEQEEATNKITNHRAGLPFLLSGAAGCGKSFVLIRAILKLLNDHEDGIILVINPTNAGLNSLCSRITAALENRYTGGYSLLKLSGPSQPRGPDCNDNCTIENNQHVYPSGEYIVKHRVIGCTPTVSLRLAHNPEFKTKRVIAIFFDEVSFTMETDVLTAIGSHLKPNETPPRIILAGDEHQLTYQPRSCINFRHGFGVSTMKRLAQSTLYASSSDLSHQLSLTLRNPPSFVRLMNLLEYKGSVRSAVESYNGKIVVMNTNGLTSKLSNDTSRINLVEAMTSLSIATKLKLDNPQESVIIICMYLSQKTILGLLQEDRNPDDKISCLTAESVQGSESDTVILTASVRNDINQNRREWSADKKRVCMCLSRAKRTLIIVGNVLNLHNYPAYRYILQEAELKNTDGYIQSLLDFSHPRYTSVLLHDKAKIQHFRGK